VEERNLERELMGKMTGLKLQLH